jgi:hypothetical protein
MGLRHIPVDDNMVGVDVDGVDVDILATNEGELKVKSRDSDNNIIILLLMEIRNLLIELTD